MPSSDPEKRRAQKRAYRARHPEKRREERRRRKARQRDLNRTPSQKYWEADRLRRTIAAMRRKAAAPKPRKAKLTPEQRHQDGLERARAYREANRDRIRERDREYNARRPRQEGPDHEIAVVKARDQKRRVRAEAAERAVMRGARYTPEDDAILLRTSSDIAAASALGRTVTSVAIRRHRLRHGLVRSAV